VEFLNRHQIKVYRNERDIQVDQKLFKSAFSYAVPTEQEQYRLLTSIFEEVSSFKDTSFYDVSSWTISHAMDIPFARIRSGNNIRISEEPVRAKKIEGKVIGGSSKLAYLFRWNEYSTPEALYRLQQTGLVARVERDTVN